MDADSTGTSYSQQARAERLIAAGRVFLAGFALLAVWLEPSEPTKHAGIVHGVLLVYLGYAVTLAVVAWRFRLPWGRAGLVVHVVDLIAFIVVVFLTHGPTSPFFVFFTFSVVCAALRWQSKGALWTAVVSLAAVIGMAFFPTALFRDPGFEMNRFIIRVAFLAVVGTLLAYLATHEQRLRVDLSRLAVWPRITPTEITPLARDILQHAAGILGTSRALLAWEEKEEPWLHLASWSSGTFAFSRESPAQFGTLVAETLLGKNFFCSDARAPLATVTQDNAGGVQRWNGAPLHADLQKRFDIGAVLALRLAGTSAEGYLFGLDKQSMTTDDLALGGVLVREVAIRLDQFYLLEELQRGAAAEERVRLARDLHDGILQSLTGVALQLETVQRLMRSEPDVARRRLEEVQTLIAREQKELRSHIQTLKPGSPSPPDSHATFNGRLMELAERIGRQWGLHAEVSVRHPEIDVQGPMAQEIYFLVHESMINAARHAKASSVRAELAVDCDHMRITVVDDGQGFPFRGYHDHAALARLNAGPVTLRERVASMGGSLAIDSTDTGTRVEIAVPITKRRH